MSKIIMSGILFLGFSALAAEVKITSWGAINQRDYDTHAGEVCGKVIDGDGTEKLLILADPGKHQGEYMTTVSPTGKFCMVVGTVTGKVEVSIIGTDKHASEKF